MKIKTDGKIIGILCSAEEETAAFDALTELGVDGYLIYTEEHKGKTALCFMCEDLPPQITDFEKAFVSLFKRNMSPVSYIPEKFYFDYFRWNKAAIGGKRLCQYV